MTKIKHLMDGAHEVERNLACIAHHGDQIFKENLATHQFKPKLFPSVDDFKKVNSFSEEKYYCLAPASIWFTKQLPILKWIELAQKLVKNGKVYLIGGPADIDLCDSILEQVGSTNCINLAGKFTFLQSAALMKNAQRNYVNDSGPMHICSAMNAPTTAFYCSTIAAFGFGPLADDSEIKETSEALPCRPCGLHGFNACPKSHFKCGNVAVKDVKS